ncbi:MAG TPA: phosphonoacetaldehyde reductase [Ignavibacteria bacterium]|nr:phosphonoacetaldehyde reductase [Ignavibacteria bacterium]HMR38837.1 phosphonoacetaldehyde reductase [Ignavibacteria bacterium]
MNIKEYFGIGAIQNIPEILKSVNSKNIFLVRGKSSFETSGAEKLLEGLLKEYNVNYFSDFTENPKLADVIKGMDSFIETQSDTVLAVGGGSIIDIAKSVNILSFQANNPESILKGETEIIQRGKPLIAVPTTSGSGSEATHFAVVYSGDKKYSLAHEFILPEYSVVDPQLTFRLPQEITATSGMDAFSQAMESYWNINANDESRKYSTEAIQLIFDSLCKAVNDAGEESRISMSRAAHLAGKAINITKTTGPHALSYYLTSHYGISHGQAVCISLGEFLKFNYEVTENDVNDGASAVEIKQSLDDLAKLSGCKDIDELKMKIHELIISAGLKTRLNELNIKGEDSINQISENVNTERLKNNPRRLTKENIVNILRNIA